MVGFFYKSKRLNNYMQNMCPIKKNFANGRLESYSNMSSIISVSCWMKKLMLEKMAGVVGVVVTVDFSVFDWYEEAVVAALAPG